VPWPRLSGFVHEGIPASLLPRVSAYSAPLLSHLHSVYRIAGGRDHWQQRHQSSRLDAYLSRPGVQPEHEGLCGLATLPCALYILCRLYFFQILDLTDNTVGFTGAVALERMLRQAPHITTLDLGDCLLKNDGARLVVGALSGAKDLGMVNLSNNDLDADFCTTEFSKLTALRASNPALRLSMEGNEIGAAGLSSLKTSLATVLYSRSGLPANFFILIFWLPPAC
jgi:hypothetical protein